MESLRGILRLLLVVFLNLFSSFTPVEAAWATPKDVCVYGCWDWTDHITWGFGPELADVVDYYEILCKSELKIKSIYYCAQVYCTEDETRSGTALINDTCKEETGVAWPSFESIALPQSELADIDRVPQDVEASSAKNPIGYPIIPDRDWLDLSIRTDVRRTATFHHVHR